MFPENVIQAAFKRVQTTYEVKTNPKPSAINDAAATTGGSSYRKKIESVRGMNILGF